MFGLIKVVRFIFIVTAIVLIGGLISSCAPMGKGFRDIVTSNNAPIPEAQDNNALTDDWQHFEIEEAPTLDLNKNDLNIPKILSHGEQWLPRTLLIRNLKVSWNADRSKIFTHGSAQWNNGSANSTGDIPFSLAGNWNHSSGYSDLVMVKSEMPPLRTPKGEDIQVRGRVYCVGVDEDLNCDSTIAEIYIRYGSIIYSGQYETTKEEDLAPHSTKKPKKNEHNHHHDEVEDGNNTEDEFYNDAVPEELDNSIEVADGTHVNEVEALFETDNIEKSNDKIQNTPVLPASPEPPKKNSLPKVVDSEVEQIINELNEKHKNNSSAPSSSSEESAPDTTEALNNQNMTYAPPSATSPSSPSQLKAPSLPPTSILSSPSSSPSPSPSKGISAPVTISIATSGSTSSTKDKKESEEDKSGADNAKFDVFAGKTKSKSGVSLPSKPKGDRPIPRVKPPLNTQDDEKGKSGRAPLPPTRPSHPDDENELEKQNPDRPGVVIPKRKPTPPVKPEPSKPSPTPVPGNPIEDGENSSGKTPENSLIGPFYAYQSFGYYHGTKKRSKGGGLQKPSNLFQMLSNIKKENLTNQFMLRSKSPTGVRSYGNFATMEFLLKSSYWVNKLRPGLSLEVKDISAERGGPLGNHSSHQNGLDIDIGYFFEGIDNNYYGRSALKGKGFDPKFDRALFWNYLKTMMTYYHDQVYMIFVHPSIKKAMCAEAQRVGDLGKSDKGVDPIILNSLRRLYPERGHHNHFHVRLRCPSWHDKKGNVSCKNPEGDLLEVTGCWSSKGKAKR